MAIDKVLIDYDAEISGIQGKLRTIERKLGVVAQAGTKSAKQIEKEFNTAEGSLADLEDGLKKIEQQLKRTTDPKELKELSQSFKEQKKLVDESRKSIDKLTGEGKKGFLGLSKTITQVGAAIGIAFTVDKLIQFGKESVQLAARAEGIRNAFEKLDDPAILDDLRSATRNTVNDIELMRAAVKAENYKIPLTQLATFFEFARIRASQTGGSVTDLVDEIVDGVGKKSLKILDNFQISSAAINEELKKTPDRAQAIANIITNEVAKAGDVALTTAQQLEQTRVAVESLQVEIGDGLIPALEELLEGFNNAIVGVKTFDTRMELLGAGLKGLVGITTDLSQDALQDLLVNGITEAGNKVSDLLDGIKDLGEEEIRSGEATRNLVRLLEAEGESREQSLQLVNFALNQRLREIKLAKEKAALDKDDEKTRKDSIKDLQEQIKFKREELQLATNRAQAIPIQREIARLEAEIARILGEETEAQKKAREEEEKRLEAAKKAEEQRLKLVQKNAEDIAKREQDAAMELANFEAEQDIQRTEGIRERADKEIELETEKARQLIQTTNATATEQELIETQLAAKIEEINKAADENIVKSRRERIQKTLEDIKAFVGAAQEINNLLLALDQKELDSLKEKNQKRLEMIQEQDEAEQEALAFKLDNRQITEQEAENRRREQQEARAAQEKNLREQIKREEDEIARKQAIRDKLLAIFNIGINTAEAIVKAVAASPLTGGLPFSAIAGAIGSLQLATVLATPLPGFKKGKVDIDGEGTDTSDSILARISRHESVINAKATKKYKAALEAANDHRLDEFINVNHVLPALKKQVAAEQGYDSYDDYMLRKDIKNGTRASKENTGAIVRAIQQNDAQFFKSISW